MPTRFILSLVVAFVVAVLVPEVGDQRAFEEIAERATIADQANALGTKCPLSRQIGDHRFQIGSDGGYGFSKFHIA